jgi:hypothetical protein
VLPTIYTYKQIHIVLLGLVERVGALEKELSALKREQAEHGPGKKARLHH